MKITAHQLPNGLQWEVRFQMDYVDTLTEDLPLYDAATDLAEPYLRAARAPTDQDPEDIDYWLERGDPSVGWGVLVFLLTF